MQFSAVSVVKDIASCVTLDIKCPGDLVYVLGVTKDELGASEYYDRFGYTGCNVPVVDARKHWLLYKDLHAAMEKGLAASVHGTYRGGLGVHLALCAMAGNLGIRADIGKAPGAEVLRADHLLFSETPGRFVVTVAPESRKDFESMMKDHELACIGKVTKAPRLDLSYGAGSLVSLPVADLKAAWKAPFGQLI
jgi:phosphoribosylformylglycinamidine synthase